MEILNYIFPKSCLVCKRGGSYLCSSCINTVSKPKPICSECHNASIDGFTHTKCLKRYSINGLTSLWNYEGVIRKGIVALKYKHATAIVKELRSYIVTELQSNKILVASAHRQSRPNSDYCLVPVPLHWYRKNNRGFNQSDELGQMIAKEMGWKYAPDLLTRKKYTIPQVTLKRDKRQENIKDVFVLNPSVYFLVQNASFVVFDDVYTTGSTLKEITKVLKRWGASSVWGLTLAR